MGTIRIAWVGVGGHRSLLMGMVWVGYKLKGKCWLWHSAVVVWAVWR